MSLGLLQKISDLNKIDPALAFTFNPSSLHSETLMNPIASPFFTVDPATTVKSWADHDLPVGYGDAVAHTDVLREKGVIGKEMKSQNFDFNRARARIDEVMKLFGDIPFNHPETPNCGVVVAGGLPAASLYDEEEWQKWSTKLTSIYSGLISPALPKIVESGDFQSPKTTLAGDIDLFVFGETEEHRHSMVRVLLDHFYSLKASVSMYGSVFKVNFFGSRELQIVCLLAQSPLGVLANFDMSHIQIGYRRNAINDKKEKLSDFFCTAAYCRMTPKSKTLVTRYNLRIPRFIKSLNRGFVPVVQANTVLVARNGSIVFSDRYPIALVNNVLTRETIVSNAVVHTFKYLPNLAGDAKETSGKRIERLDQEINAYIYGTHEHRGKIEASMRDHPDLTARATFLDKVAANEREIDYAENNILYTFGSVDQRITDKITNSPSESEARIGSNVAWGHVTDADMAMKLFKPKSDTLINGFDIYTGSINSTLPITSDGKTINLSGSYRILLRGLKINPLQFSEYTIPIRYTSPAIIASRPHVKFIDTNLEPIASNPMFFCHDNMTVVRRITALVLFGEPKKIEEYQEELDEKLKMNDLNYEEWLIAAENKLSIKQRLQNHHEGLLKKAHHDSKRAGIKGAKPNAEHLKSLIDSITKPENRGYVSMSERILHMEMAISVIKANRKLNREQLENRLKAKLETRNAIQYSDLHSSIVAESNIKTISLRDVPFMMAAFALGGSFISTESYSFSSVTILKTDRMVKVIADMSFDNMYLFDVDDLLLNPFSVDLNENREYNAIVNLVDLPNWIIDGHEHVIDKKEQTLLAYTRFSIIALLKNKLEALDLFKPAYNDRTMHLVSDTATAIRDFLYQEKLEDIVYEANCNKPHAIDGYAGIIPAIECTRLYVTTYGQ